MSVRSVTWAGIHGKFMGLACGRLRRRGDLDALQGAATHGAEHLPTIAPYLHDHLTSPDLNSEIGSGGEAICKRISTSSRVGTKTRLRRKFGYEICGPNCIRNLKSLAK